MFYCFLSLEIFRSLFKIEPDILVVPLMILRKLFELFDQIVH